MGSSRFYDDYYVNQAGSGLSVYHGGRMQTGHGLGNILGGLFKRALPLIKQGVSTVGKEIFHVGTDILGDALSGKNIKTSAKTRLKAAGKNLGKRAVTEAKARLSGKKQQGGGGNRRNTTRKGQRKIKRPQTTRRNGIKRKTTRRKASNRKKTKWGPDIFS